MAGLDDRAGTRDDLNEWGRRALQQHTAALGITLARLQANEARLALALEAGAMGTFTIDIPKRHAYCDERHERLYGRQPRPEGHSFDVWRAALHPEDRDRVLALVDRTMRGVDPELSAEYRIVWPDGSEHWLLCRGRLFLDAQGRPDRIAGVEQDIDERKSLELELLHIADSEQRRIGQELHDDIQQRLTGLGLIAESLAEDLAKKSLPEQKRALRLASAIGEVYERVNRLSHGLVPLELGGEGLSVVLARMASVTDLPGRLRCRFKNPEALEVRDGFVATHLHRIAQEALGNAIRHSGADRISITLARAEGLTVLTVKDNGRGIREKPQGEGRGLRIMAYRASLIGGTLKIARARQGTSVSCAIALPSRGGNGHPGPSQYE